MPDHDFSFGYQPGQEIDYATLTTNLVVTATTAATAQSVCDGAAISYDGATRVRIEFSAPDSNPGTAGNMLFELWDGSTDLGIIAITGTKGEAPATGSVFLTPSAGVHTYHVKVWKSAASGTFTVFAGTAFSGSNPTADPPTWMRITKA